MEELSGLMRLVTICGLSKIRFMNGVSRLWLSAEFGEDSGSMEFNAFWVSRTFSSSKSMLAKLVVWSSSSVR